MASPRLCSIPGCGKPHDARGWCKNHYGRWSRYGDPLAGRIPPNGEPYRFLVEEILPYRGDECKWGWLTKIAAPVGLEERK